MAESEEFRGQGESAQDPLADGLRAVFADGATAASSSADGGAPEVPRRNSHDPARLGDFEIIGELGRGGMGIV